jgi:hypothetical protein
MESWQFKRLEELLEGQIVLLELIAKILHEDTPEAPTYAKPIKISVDKEGKHLP